MYVCCRDGNKRGHTGLSKTGKTRKHRYSRKMDDYCIARMIATQTQSEGRVDIKYISTHTNHELTLTECKHLPLPNSVREDIRQQFAAGISLERIMDSMFLHVHNTINVLRTKHIDVRGFIGKRDQRQNFMQNVTRQQFVTRQDCRFVTNAATYDYTYRVFNNYSIYRNICRKLNDFSRHRHSEDAVSVQRIVEELRLESPSPMLYYKAQGVKDPKHPKLAEDTFLLVLMTNFQAGLFELFGNKIVCQDSTHKTNQYRFKLTTMVVPDEYHNGMSI